MEGFVKIIQYVSKTVNHSMFALTAINYLHLYFIPYQFIFEHRKDFHQILLCAPIKDDSIFERTPNHLAKFVLQLFTVSIFLNLFNFFSSLKR